MSYILDALKKSDQQRQRGATPTLLTTQMPAAASEQRSFLWYGLLAAVLVGAGVAIGSLRPWDPGPTVPAQEPSTARHSRESMAYQKAATPRPMSPPVGAESRTKRPADGAPLAPIPTSALIKPNDAVPPATRQHREPRKAIAAIPKQVAPPAPEKKPPVGAPAEPELLTMSELPLAIQQEIPKMSISAHAYASERKDRLVSINDQLLREGASLAPGLTLEQITPDGMIFTFRGYRFYRGVKNTAATAVTR